MLEQRPEIKIDWTEAPRRDGENYFICYFILIVLLISSISIPFNQYYDRISNMISY